MRKRETERYRSVLEAQLASLLGQGGRTVQEMVRVDAEELPDPNDRATKEEGQTWSLRLRDRDRKLIAKIEQALARLEAGTFGTCETCGGEIGAARLRARPITTLCIDCKTEAERLER